MGRTLKFPRPETQFQALPKARSNNTPWAPNGSLLRGSAILVLFGARSLLFSSSSRFSNLLDIFFRSLTIVSKRLTFGTIHARLLTYLFWICGAAYVAVVLTVFLGCRPLQLNWQVVPMPPSQCTFRRQNSIVVAVLNILTDAAVLAVPFPMLWRLKMPTRRKIMISILLSSGIFVITAAIIRVVYSLDAHPSAANINRWGTRETIIGIFATNIPIIRPMISRAFWTWGPYNPQSSSSKSGSQSWRGRRLGDSGRDIELGSTSIKISHPRRSDSQEELTRTRDVIYVQTKYDVQTHDRDDLSSSKTASWTETRVPSE